MANNNNMMSLHQAASTLLASSFTMNNAVSSLHFAPNNLLGFHGHIANIENPDDFSCRQRSFSDLNFTQNTAQPSIEFPTGCMIEDLLLKNREISMELKKSRDHPTLQFPIVQDAKVLFDTNGVPVNVAHPKAASDNDTDATAQRSSDDGENSDSGKNSKPASKRRMCPWSKDEHQRFLLGLKRFRTDETETLGRTGKQSVGLGPGTAELIAVVVETRSAAQVRSHAQKYFQRMRRGDKSC